MSEHCIDQRYIEKLLDEAQNTGDAGITRALDKAERFEGLNHREIAALLVNENPDHLKRIFAIAGKIKQHIYGNRIVMFAPLYVSDYCVNRCAYCSFNRSHGFTMTLLQVVFLIFPFIRQSAKNAARPALFAATSHDAIPGKYYGPWFFGVMGPTRRALIPMRAKNRTLRKNLWDLSVLLTGIDFPEYL